MLIWWKQGYSAVIFVYVSILFYFRTNPKRQFKTLSADVKNKPWYVICIHITSVNVGKLFHTLNNTQILILKN